MTNLMARMAVHVNRIVIFSVDRMAVHVHQYAGQVEEPS
jgi:hypothetical protein